jgi:hypothetical protein
LDGFGNSHVEKLERDARMWAVWAGPIWNNGYTSVYVGSSRRGRGQCMSVPTDYSTGTT